MTDEERARQAAQHKEEPVFDDAAQRQGLEQEQAERNTVRLRLEAIEREFVAMLGPELARKVLARHDSH